MQNSDQLSRQESRSRDQAAGTELRQSKSLGSDVESPTDPSESTSTSSGSSISRLPDEQASIPDQPMDSSGSVSPSADSSAYIPPDELESILDQLRTQLEHAEQQSLIDVVKRQINKKDHELNKAVAEMTKMHRVDGYKRDDVHFIKATMTLRLLIKNWSRSQMFVVPGQHRRLKWWNPWKTPSVPFSELKEALKIVGPNYAEYLETPRDVLKLMQAYVWTRPVQNVFGKNVWADGMQFTELYEDLKPSSSPASPISSTQVEQFHEWRAMTARLIDQKIKGPPGISRIKDVITGPLKPIAAKGKIDSAEITNIIQRAVELDAEFAKQKAYFSFSSIGHPARSVQYDPELMDDIYNQDLQAAATEGRRKVRLFVAPILFKCGNSDGGSYNIETSVLKGEVICSSHETSSTTLRP
ncbi:MAG: hypothetical protein M1840_006683 [Geoglossum simile]|nr:MAG: hypothetical protein M1840_006683 [Geoglossum simile]